MSMKIYCAGTMTGLTFDEIMDRYKTTKSALDPHFQVYHPMVGKGFLKDKKGPLKAKGYGHLASDHNIFHRDKWMVHQCDVLFVDLRQATNRVSIGTMFEMAWAIAYDKYVVLLIREDWGVHDHAFVRMANHAVFHDFDEAIEYVTKLPHGEF